MILSSKFFTTIISKSFKLSIWKITDSIALIRKCFLLCARIIIDILIKNHTLIYIICNYLIFNGPSDFHVGSWVKAQIATPEIYGCLHALLISVSVSHLLYQGNL